MQVASAAKKSSRTRWGSSEIYTFHLRVLFLCKTTKCDMEASRGNQLEKLWWPLVSSADLDHHSHRCHELRHWLINLRLMCCRLLMCWDIHFSLSLIVAWVSQCRKLRYKEEVELFGAHKLQLIHNQTANWSLLEISLLEVRINWSHQLSRSTKVLNHLTFFVPMLEVNEGNQ